MARQSRPEQPERESVRFEPGQPPRDGNRLTEWGAEQVRESAKGFALSKVAGVAARTGMGARLFLVTRWFWIAEWGALAVAVVLALLGIVGLIQKDVLLGSLVLVLAAVAAGVWLAVRALRRFVERQAARAFAKFESMVQRGSARMSDWPAWYRQNK